jgi:excisionase family DNA binding protein
VTEQVAERLTFSVTEAAIAAGVSERTFREYIARGDVPVVRIGRRVLILRSQLEGWLKDRVTV